MHLKLSCRRYKSNQRLLIVLNIFFFLGRRCIYIDLSGYMLISEAVALL